MTDWEATSVETEHPDDCGYCLAGEPSRHNYEPTELPSYCLICADPVDYCPGHGAETVKVNNRHDDGDHRSCNRFACTDSTLTVHLIHTSKAACGASLSTWNRTLSREYVTCSRCANTRAFRFGS